MTTFGTNASVSFFAIILMSCSSSPASVGGSGGSGAGGGASTLPRPPVLGGGDGFCISEERFVSTCEWAAAAKRIIWARVKDFELLLEPSYLRSSQGSGWTLAERCDRVYAAGALTLTVLQNLKGSGEDEVTVLLRPGALGSLVFERRSDASYEALGSTDAGFAVGQEFGLALHQPEGSDHWFAPGEQVFPLDEEGRLAWPVDDECGLHMPEVLTGGMLEELSEELLDCEDSTSAPWQEPQAAQEMLIDQGTAFCSEGTPAMGGAGGDASSS